MSAWVVWLVVAAALVVAEIGTTTLVLAMLAGGALAAAGADALGADVVVQALVFALGSGALLLGVRPVARRHLRMPIETRTGVAALVGAQAVVLERVDAHSGRVKIGGEVWSARAYDPSEVIEVGRPVDVLSIQGATALVVAGMEQ